ncbi:helix-turn-helix domain-containing protein [Vibrio chagasii]|uniref:helix-turn-helix domain-containing protein n=1 Tax=Vibrio chagasii TaxID=170679 RepID=UPI001EFDC651|nr:helix-turn-helix transcriptional regulator [Vibrio chagasii]MCG9673578.1 helix-turn-helix domain-containing protein [Vibrio chagasii]CAH7215899.1 HTH cro/C1-type domain-containing protein [Vibrio chagasii]
MFSRDDFGEKLRSYRLENNYSQKELADTLSLSHVSFQDITQSMISLWESQKRLPSLLKRILIANFFLCEYCYSSDEILKIKKLESYKNRLIHNDSGYPLIIDKMTCQSIDTLSDKDKKTIFDYHRLVYKEEIESNLKYDDSNGKLEFLLYFSSGLLVGHVVKNSNYIISLGSQCYKIRHDILSLLAEDYKSQLITIHILDSSLSQFIVDSNSGFLFLQNNKVYTTCNLAEFDRNPWVMAIRKGLTDFKFLRYAELSKRKEDVYSRLFQLGCE